MPVRLALQSYMGLVWGNTRAGRVISSDFGWLVGWVVFGRDAALG